MKTYVIVNEVKKVVEKVSAELTGKLQQIDQNITGVHYEHGHPLEIIETLREKDNSNNFKFRKYPLIALFQDFPEDTSSNQVGIQSEATLHIIIAMTTLPDYKAAKRYDLNIIPILYPIYNEFTLQMYRSPAFKMAKPQFDARKFDRLYWGREGLMKNEANLFDDWIDCIELKNLRIKVNEKLC